ncbi:MAG: TonB-dependent receptor [Calditrichaceae bacterium]|nr:TonB-dependent receptor [Calditrichaceae bacterium]MBN2709587.1 TonB-dependent receptor [Calditrichaceae bacterium]RQV92386.1 MAG: TonB-dependent receptor [Calditrichota bacterium]
MNYRRNFYSIVFMLLLVIFSLASEKGTITGVVVDSETGDPLIGANIYLDNTSMGAASDLDGRYSILNIPQGSYTLVISVIGYAETRIENVEVISDDITRLDVAVKSEILTTEVVVVEAKAVTNTEAALLKSRQKSISVSDAISAEEINKSASSDAAAAMKKVTGASVVGEKYVYIRGLGERYTATTLNGAELPSADPDKKSFQLDLIPANMLENINTKKTFTPDQPGTFTGGLVDVTLKDYPEKYSFNFSMEMGYNSVSSFNENFILGNSGSTDWLGFDDGTRSLPDELKNGPVHIPNLTSLDKMSPEAGRAAAYYIDRLSNSFSETMIPKSAGAPLKTAFSLSIGNTINFDDQKQSIGYFTSLSYKRDAGMIDNGEIGRYKLVGNLNEAAGLEPEFAGTDLKSNIETNWGGIANIAYKNNQLGQFKLSYMHTQSADHIGRYLNGVRERDRSTDRFESYVISWIQRSLDTYQMDGGHKIPFLSDLKLDWKLAYSVNTQDEPDQRYFFNIYSIQPDDSKYYAFDQANTQPISRYFRDLSENNLSTQINLTIPFNQWSGHPAKLQAGFSYNDIEREYNQYRFDYNTNNLRLSNYGGDVELLMQDAGIIDTTSSRISRWFGMTIDNAATRDSTNFFTGNAEIYAYYAMIDLPVFSRLRFIGGARLETTDMRSKTLDPDDGYGKIDDTDILPSLNLIYMLSGNMNLRAVYTNTIARPTFREFAPYQSFEFQGDFIYRGNPNLKRTLIKNYDFRWEWFLNPGEIMAVSAFFKQFENPLEPFIDPTFSDDNTLRSIKNVNEARVYGAEFEFRKGLGFLSSVADNFHIGTNITLVHSEVDIPEEDLAEKIANGDSNPDKKRPFAGQSPYIYNINFTYDNYKSLTTAGIYLNKFGDRLFMTGRHATPDIYERGFTSMDFKFSQGLGDKLVLSFTAKNLLNPNQVFSYQMKNDFVDKEYIYAKVSRGISTSVKITYKL